MTAVNRRMVLVMGARGYVGGRVSQALATRPDLALIGVSRQTRPPQGWPNGRFLCLDHGMETTALRESLPQVDSIIHLAGANQALCRSNPKGALAASTGLVTDLLEAASSAGVKRFIYVSTAHVYGSPLVGRIDETRLPRPAHPYSITHHTCEDIVLAARDNGAIQGMVVRLSNGIGAPAWARIDDWSTVGNDLCRQAVTTGTLRLSSSGEQWRDFVTLGDVATALLHLVDLPQENQGDGLFNLGGTTPMRIIDVAELVAQRSGALFGISPPILRPAGAPAEPIDYRIDRLIGTGFRPSRDLTGEIDATLRLCAESFGMPERR